MTVSPTLPPLRPCDITFEVLYTCRPLTSPRFDCHTRYLGVISRTLLEALHDMQSDTKVATSEPMGHLQHTYSLYDTAQLYRSEQND